jgi:hypothetical protein
MEDLSDPVDLVGEAARLVLIGDLDGARVALRGLDTTALEAERKAAHSAVRERVTSGRWVSPETRPQQGRDPGRSIRLAVFRRDHYVCRYEHCGRRTIDDAVLKLLSEALPDVLPYHSNWKLGSVHPIYWTHTASLEHVLAWSTHGTNDVERNLVTACSCCQYAKNYYDLGVLGWEIAPVCDASSSWDGLKAMESELKWTVSRLSEGK